MSENADRSLPKAEFAEDSELLRCYAKEGNNAAFAELARRRIGLVYSVALRQCHGDRHRAEDVTQTVFVDLARKAATLARRPVLAGWLHRSTQYAAAKMIRTEQRRTEREREANAMETILVNDGPTPDWDQLRPILDQALNEIAERDRDAVLLRFFDGRPFAEIGQRLGLSENTTRMRVERALEKLSAALAKRGISSTTAAVGVALAGQTAMAAPAGLLASVTGGALAGGAARSAGWLAVFMGPNKVQIGIASAVALAGSAGYLVQTETNAGLRREIAATESSPAAIASLKRENQRLTARAHEMDLLREDDAEFKRVAQSAAELRLTENERARLLHVRERTRLLADLESQCATLQKYLERLNAVLTSTNFAVNTQDLSEEGRSIYSAKAQQLSEAIKSASAQMSAKQLELKAVRESIPPSE